METANVPTPSTASQIEHVVFDLDDTLLDTSQQLIPRATREACEAMIDAGLRTTVEQALKACRDREVHTSRQDLFMSLVKKFGVDEGVDGLRVASVGHHAFYNRKVDEDISVFPGVNELLKELRAQGYRVHLVTQGHRATQEEKIQKLGIGSAFESISHVDPSRGERKGEAFRKLMTATGAPPSHYLSIGNRVDTDISEAKDLGWKTCWMKYGEYRFLTPSRTNEKPDFTIASLAELIDTCQL